MIARVAVALVAFALSALLLTASLRTPAPAVTRAEPPAVPGCASRVQARLFFGLSSPRGSVSEAEWEGFLQDVVTSRFPDGLTVLNASGQWRTADEPTQREASRVLEIVYDESPHARCLIDQIAAIYKRRFEQNSVLVVRTRADVCF